MTNSNTSHTQKILLTTLTLLFLTGFSAATASGLNLDGTGTTSATVELGTSVSIAATDDGTADSQDTLYAVVDLGSDGTYDSSTDLKVQTTNDDSGSEVSIGSVDTTGVSTGTYTVYVTEASSDGAPTDLSTYDITGGSLTVEDTTAPSVDTNTGLTLDEGTTSQITSSELSSSDASSNTLTYSVNTAPTEGTIFVSTEDGQYQSGEEVTSFTQANIDSGNLYYKNSGSETTGDAFDFSVSDGNGNSNSGTFSITVNSVNDQPTLSASASNPTFTEDDPAAGLYSGAAADVVESGQNVDSLTVTVSNLADGSQEKLVVDGTEVSLTDTASVSGTANNNLDVSVSVSSSTATVTIATTGTITETTAENVVNNLAYRHTGDNPSTSNDRTVTITQIKDDGGTTNNGDDTSSPSISSTVSLTAQNDAPTMSTDTRTLNSISEDATSNTGTQVSTVLGSNSGTFGDVDGDTVGIAVTGVTDTNGNWQYKTTSGIWTDFSSVSASSAVALDENDYVRFVPNSDYSGSSTGSLTIRAWDQTTGSSGSTVDASSTGGTTAFSSNSASTTVTVQDAPEVTLIKRASGETNPTNADSVDFTVTFSESVSSVDTSDFALSGTITGSSISGVSGSGDTRTVSVNSISGDGELGLDLIDDDSITTSDSNSVPLGGEGTSGTADGSLTSGETFTIDNTVDLPSDAVTATVQNGNEIVVQVNSNEELKTGSFSVSSSTVGEASIDADGWTETQTGGQSQDWIYEATYTGASDGSYDADVTTIEDQVGNTLDYTETSTADITVDANSPTFTVNEDTDSGPVQTDIIKVTVSDAGTSVQSSSTSYAFSSDSTCNAEDSYNNDYTSGADFTISGDHTEYLCVKATDGSSNTAYKQVGQLNTDNTAPSLEGYTVTNPSSQDVRVTFNSSEQLSTVSATVNLPGGGTAPLSGFSSSSGDFSEDPYNDGSYNYTATYSGSTDGSYEVVLDTASDAAGNNGAGSVSSQTVTVDTTAPTINSATTNSTSTVNVTLQDATSKIDVSTVEAGDFTVAGNSIKSISGFDSDSSSITGTLTVKDGEEFSTGATPTVRISGINDTAGNEATTGSVDASDGVKPAVKSISYTDTGTDGKIDRIDVTYSETLSSGADAGDYSVTGTDSTVVDTIDSATVNGDTVEIGVTLSTVDTNPAINLSYTSSSASGNKIQDDASTKNTASDFSKSTISDSAAPVDTGYAYRDTNKDGEVDQVAIKYSEPVALDEAETGDFSVSNLGGSATIDSVAASSNEVQLTVSGTTADTTNYGSAKVSYTASNGEAGSIDDGSAGNTASNIDTASLTDEANPVLLQAEIDHSNSGSSVTKVNLKFTESISSGSGDLTTDQSATALNVGSTPDAATATATVQDDSDNNKVLQTGDNPKITDATVLEDGSNSVVLEDGQNVEIDTFRKQLNKGWNFVSFPIADTSTPAISEVMDTSKVEAVWKYNGTGWESWTPDSGNQNDFSTVEGGVGYQVKAKEQFTIAPNVNNVKEKKGFAQVDLNAGYNLVGHFQEYNQDASATGAFNDLDSGSLGAVYEQATGFEVSNIQGSSKGVKTGSAYWIDVNGDTSNVVYNMD